jgi:hypothetical protein
VSEELRHAIAEEVIDLHPGADKATLGQAFLDTAEGSDMADFDDWCRAQLLRVAGQYVSGIRAAREKRRRNERLLSRGVAVATGRPITPTISVRGTDGSRQQVLWVEATPRQFVDAVLREQAVVDGRAESNAIRMQLAELVRGDEQLMALPALRDVCAELAIDPDTLGLEELEAS